MNRNNTNQLLKDLCLMVEQDNSNPSRITVAIGGQLVTGTMITESEFFALPQNSALQNYFNEEIKAKRDAILNDISSGKELDFPDELREWFIYLDNAYYMVGSMRFPDRGISMQLRVSDVSVFSYTGFNA